MSNNTDFREQIDCAWITEDGRCLKYSSPDYVDWCVLGPCGGYEPGDAVWNGRAGHV